MPKDAYIIAAVRTAVGRARSGAFAHVRPDDLLAHVILRALRQCPGLDRNLVGDVIVGCAMPEGPQGMNVARIGLLLAGLPESVPGMTINRFCASGLQAVSLAADRIRLGEASVMIAAGTESMSLVPMMGHRPELNMRFLEDDNIGIAYGMGVTAEKIAQRWSVTREDQDAYALESHRRAVLAIDGGAFVDEIVPYDVRTKLPGDDGSIVSTTDTFEVDEGPRRDTSLEALARLRPVFAANGTVTAGTSSQMSDGAAALILVDEPTLKALGVEPLARFVSFETTGVEPEIMGVGPIASVPPACRRAGINVNDLDHIELNEAFAAQTLACIRDLGLDPAKVNPLGGAIALGHPLGATGAIRTATLLHALKRTGGKYGMVSMCVGTGMGAAGVFERC